VTAVHTTITRGRRQMNESAIIPDQRAGGGKPGGSGRRVRRPGWRTIMRWGRWPVVACLLASLGAGIANADNASVTTSYWSGYVLPSGGPYQTVGATFVVPDGVCTQGSSESGPATAYWVGVGSYSATTIAQAGFKLNCDGGHPNYFAWVADATGYYTPMAQPVQPGDQLTVNISCPYGGNICTQDLQDVTQNWQQSSDLGVPDGFSADYAAVAAENYNGGTYSGAVLVSGATVNGAPIGQYGPQAWQQPASGSGSLGFTGSLVPSPLDTTGEDFSFVWNGYPGS
jgi:hypothetical protein